jgi:hypothetical protein
MILDHHAPSFVLAINFMALADRSAIPPEAILI